MKRKAIDKATFINYLNQIPNKNYTEVMFNTYFKGHSYEIYIPEEQNKAEELIENIKEENNNE